MAAPWRCTPAAPQPPGDSSPAALCVAPPLRQAGAARGQAGGQARSAAWPGVGRGVTRDLPPPPEALRRVGVASPAVLHRALHARPCEKTGPPPRLARAAGASSPPPAGLPRPSPFSSAASAFCFSLSTLPSRPLVPRAPPRQARQSAQPASAARHRHTVRTGTVMTSTGPASHSSIASVLAGSFDATSPSVAARPRFTATAAAARGGPALRSPGPGSAGGCRSPGTLRQAAGAPAAVSDSAPVSGPGCTPSRGPAAFTGVVRGLMSSAPGPVSASGSQQVSPACSRPSLNTYSHAGSTAASPQPPSPPQSVGFGLSAGEPHGAA